MSDQNAQWQECIDFWTRRALLHISNVERLSSPVQQITNLHDAKRAIKALRKASERVQLEVTYVDREFTGEEADG